MNYILTLLIFLLAILIIAITPYITRRTESFGITIPSDLYNDETLRGYRKKYVTLTTVLGILVTLIMVAFINALTVEAWMILFSICIVVFIVGGFMIYLHFHKKMKVLKEERKWFSDRKETIVVDTKFYNQKKTYSNAWFLIPLLITLGSIIFTFVNYDKFPDQLPMQYDLQGEVSRYAEKSIGTLMLFPLMQLFMTGLFVFLNVIIGRSKQQIDPEHPEKSLEQNLIFRRRWSVFTIISGTAMVILFALINLTYLLPLDPNLLFILTMVFTGIIVLGAVILTIFTGQGGSRVRISNGKNGEIIQRDDDRHWKLGQFYFNPDDPAVWVEKRFGSGWTFNLARPIAWLTLIGILIIPLLITFLAQ